MSAASRDFGNINAGGGITNGGTITAASEGIYGLRVQTFAGGIDNAGKITAGEGIDIGSVSFSAIPTQAAGSPTPERSAKFHGIYAFSESMFAGGIVNASSGTIIASVGTGIEVQSTGTFGGGISNAGTISGASGPAVLVENLSVFSGGITDSGASRRRTAS